MFLPLQQLKWTYLSTVCFISLLIVQDRQLQVLWALGTISQSQGLKPVCTHGIFAIEWLACFVSLDGSVQLQPDSTVLSVQFNSVCTKSVISQNQSGLSVSSLEQCQFYSSIVHNMRLEVGMFPGFYFKALHRGKRNKNMEPRRKQRNEKLLRQEGSS